MADLLAVRFAAEPIRSLAFGSISTAYAGIGTEMTRPIRMMHMVNTTDQVLMLSFDGIEDHIIIPSNGYYIYDITTNKTSEQGFYLAQGERLYVRDIGVACTLGGAYLTVFYGEGD